MIDLAFHVLITALTGYIAYMVFKQPRMPYKAPIMEKQTQPHQKILKTAKGVYIYEQKHVPVANTDELQWLDEQNERRGRDD